jgi:hypothetical protein
MFSSATKSAAQGGGYNLTKSLRFRASASAYLNKSYSSGAGNTTTFTISCWVKRGQLNATNGTQYLFSGGSGANISIGYGLGTVLDTLSGNLRGTGGTNYFYETNAIFRDPSAWYHVVFAVDTTQATSTNRMKLYVNGVLQTLLVANYPPQNQVMLDTGTRYIASEVSRYYFDGYITDQYFIDGQQLTASSFGSTNATTGVWQPAKYTGTYGTTGFYLQFTNITSTTTLGYDTSGNSNNWTTNNLSLTTGATYDSMNDVPTLTNATAANYCVMNPLSVIYNTNFKTSDGNLKVFSSSADAISFSTIVFPKSSGKWYAECTVNSISGTAYTNIRRNDAVSGADWSYGSDGTITGTSSGATYTTGDVIGVAYDWSAQTISWYKNNSLQGTSTSVSQTADLTFANYIPNTSTSFYWNFGQQGFKYTPPTGYKALNTYNLPDSTVVKGNKYMDATLYTGTLLSNAITNTASFKPDLVWIKSRSVATDNKLTDSVRGVTKALISNSGGSETTDTQGLTAFNSNGFTVGTNTDYNTLSATYVGWQWQAGQGSTSSNTNGSITSTVSVNTTSGFSIVTFTGTGSSATVGHGLGIAPNLIIWKTRNQVNNWNTYHSSIGNTSAIQLNLTSAIDTSINYWNNTSPTSSVFSIGSYTSPSTINCVAYCWASIAGFSAFGSYTGNGSADNAFVYTGFRPKYVMIKRTDATNDWYILDSARNTYNPETWILAADLSDADYNNSNTLDFVSNGFKIRNAGSAFGASSGNYVYAAFAENPFKNALAR